VLASELLTLTPANAAASDNAPTYTVLYSFTGGVDGGVPAAGLIRDEAGNLYGTTSAGGSSGAGVVFKLDPSGKETVLYSFTGGADGGIPVGSLIRDQVGNLYGTTVGGGNFTSPMCAGFGCGVIFKLDPSGNETVLHAFTNGADGGSPMAALIRDEAGNVYGTASTGGNGSSSCPFGCGLVFKLDSSGNETVLYTFSGSADGASPDASLLRDGSGNFYSSAQFGGNFTSPVCAGFACGVIFKLDLSGKETVLHTFNGTDGASPYDGLTRDAAGNLYGTTGYGDNTSASCPNGSSGCGVVFKLNPRSRQYMVLYAFTGEADGYQLFGGLTRAGGDEGFDADQTLYGTTFLGGNFSGPCGAFGCGVIFRVDRRGKHTVLHTFGGTDGAGPGFVVLLRHHGSLYGTTGAGGAFGAGVVFKLTLNEEGAD